MLLAAYPGNIAIGPLALTEPAALVLLLGGFWAILRWGRWPAAVAVGVTFGYSALVKPTFLVLVVVLAVFALLNLSDDNKVEGRRRAWWCLAAIVIFILVQAPWVYRNYERLGTLVIGSTLGGLNFYMANNPGTLTGATGPDPLSSYSNELDRSKIGYERGIQWIRENPFDFVIVATKRFLRFAGRTSVQMNISVQEKCQCDGQYYRVLSWLDTIWWYMCWILAIYAVWKHRIIYSREPWAAMLFMMIAFLFPVHSVYIGVGRHHEPIAGLILLVATTALSSTFTQRHITARAQQRDP